MADRTQHLQQQLDRHGVSSLLRQQFKKKEQTNGALDGGRRGWGGDLIDVIHFIFCISP